MIESLTSAVMTVGPFLIVISLLIAFHEFGHYFAARLCGLKVETFSIGFGKELGGWTDRTGARWRLAALPLGGYVKMLGDADPSGITQEEVAESQRAESFNAKTVGQRAFIVAAGPAANFLLAIVLLAGIFMTLGRPYTPPVIGGVVDESPAAEAGLVAGDRVLSIDGAEMDSFEEFALYVRLRPNQPLVFDVERGGASLALTVTPEPVGLGDGGAETIGRIGAQSADVAVRDPVGPFAAVGAATAETIRIIDATLTAIGQMFAGDRSVKELGGPLRIAEVSADAAESGFAAFIMLAVVLSINLGLLNLFPIPVLDGGHLVFYAFEALRGRPLGERAQEIGFRLGLAVVVALMVFATWNDLQRFFSAGLGLGGAS